MLEGDDSEWDEVEFIDLGCFGWDFYVVIVGFEVFFLFWVCVYFKGICKIINFEEMG